MRRQLYSTFLMCLAITSMTLMAALPSRAFSPVVVVLQQRPPLFVAASPLVVVSPTTTCRLSTAEDTEETATATATATANTEEETTRRLCLTLEKPLGMILEEVEEGAARGVYVLELAEEGSAAASPHADQIVRSALVTVMGDDVTQLTFDQVMERIIEAPSPVDLEFDTSSSSSTDDDDNQQEEEELWMVGTPVTIVVKRDGQEDLVIDDAKVGDNLRSTLLKNDVEVYRGFKAKIGNCGGGGQCGFCAVNFVESEGWEPRSDYEAQKLKNNKNPNMRLSCLNNIQGPVTIQM